MATKKRGRRAPAKKSRAPKFIQLAAGDGGLYALDKDGQVWELLGVEPMSGWHLLSQHRRSFAEENE
jgi:hypothetical protein